jgi:hypothetical protein
MHLSRGLQRRFFAFIKITIKKSLKPFAKKTKFQLLLLRLEPVLENISEFANMTIKIISEKQENAPLLY